MKKRSCKQIDFIFPDDGVMLTDAAGTKTDGGLMIKVRVDASDEKKLTLNGVPMQRVMHGVFGLDVLLDSYKNPLTVCDTESGESHTIDVYYLRLGCRKYRFSLDDNIWFLQNLTENKDKYESMFEDPYLNMIKRVHDEYGSKFHVNIYYETPRHGGFNLSEMTDKYKDEWRANSDWLRLSFHANANEPGRPYAHTSYEDAYFEAERVNREILRFAGEEAFAKTVTTVHFGDCSVEAARAFRDLGYRAFVSSYKKTDDGIDIRMYLDSEKCEILREYGFYYDKEEDIIHFRYNGGIQHKPIEDFCASFDEQDRQTPKYLFKDFCLHEQYFHEDYVIYQPNYYEKLTTAAKWCREHGYESIFMDELFEFNTH